MAAPPAAVAILEGGTRSERLDLLVEALPHLAAAGLAVAVVVRDGDPGGAAADEAVLARAGAFAVAHWRGDAATEPSPPSRDLAARCDLVVECRSAPRPVPTLRPTPRSRSTTALGAGPDRGSRLLDALRAAAGAIWRKREIIAGILIGGASTRMGRPKHLAPVGDGVLLGRVIAAVRPHVAAVALLGGTAPPGYARLRHVPDTTDTVGPLAGMLAAMRASPTSCWLFLACDTPLLDDITVAWLIAQRQPGAWVIQPRGRSGWPEPLFAIHEPMARSHLEALAREGRVAPRHLAGCRGHVAPVMPPELAARITSADTIAELDRLTTRER